ncbi:response regulator transcription factor [Actinoplanes derwentensis]|uniref:DNA-binding response regulator, OmpR family, contains REC and winged-helix (WHTH) domain n=1 Tax=Actinoplanes derwentensis TaxID=113562 RepID=A0A1H1UJ59_9ACTN|nr:response regulator transcription factor [Actinoplanes derwentensis]GID88080.1 DNA-binding response regulator [Actinoplanes derwentensis]SDS72515.1 DNA-binding response regulator, OmpR family, contains REC and winged-helix (wHTH) domain [Actinoplanes derwentensis]
MCAHVLVADDDPRQAELVRRYLTADGHETVVVHDGRAALDLARRLRPDLLVLDVMMPELDGLHVCRTLRAESDILVLMLTARTSEDDLLLGLELGADDYLTKPYGPRELMARVRTLLRRASKPASEPAARRVGRVGLDPVRHLVTVDDEPIECTRGEFAILTAMSEQPDRVFTRAQLLHHTRGIDRSSTERTIDVHVLNLRRKIETDPQRPAQLITVYGVGYKLAHG